MSEPNAVELIKRFGPDPERTRLVGSLLVAPKIVTNTMRPSWTFSSSYPRKGGDTLYLWSFRAGCLAYFVDEIVFSQLIERTTLQISTTQFWKTQVELFHWIHIMSSNIRMFLSFEREVQYWQDIQGGTQIPIHWPTGFCEEMSSYYIWNNKHSPNTNFCNYAYLEVFFKSIW